MMKGALLDCDSLGPEDLDLTPILSTLDDWQVYPVTTRDETAARIAGCELVLTNKVIIDAELMTQTPTLRMIGVLATGTNNIDLEAARQRNITVCNVVKYGTMSVVQHTMALMLALTTRWHDYDRDVRAGQWSKSPFFCMMDHPVAELDGKNLVIAGYGELGQGVARLAEAFGMNVLVASRPGQGPSERDGISRRPLQELLPEADVLSLHCPLTPETHNLIDQAALSLMKPSSLLINCARGGLVDEVALADALRNGQIAGAATDVLTIEPPREGNPLLDTDIPNLLLTPHCAWVAREARQRLVNQMADNICQYLKQTPQNVVT